MKYLYCLILMLCASFRLSAQSSTDLPKVIPPSPSTQQFMRYIDYPTGNFTGVPGITIPLYTVKSGDLSVPITLSYNASGTKPSDPNGFVGMNWTLSNGGKISRTVVDQPDEASTTQQPATFFSIYQFQTQSPTTRNYNLWNWDANHFDTEPDIFSYSFNGHSGKFVLKRDAERTPMLLPYKPIKFKPMSAGGPGYNYINVIDESGIKYTFNASEFVEQPYIVTAWDITQMTSATDPTNTISFLSSGATREFATRRVDMIAVDDRDSNSGISRNCYPKAEGTEAHSSKPDSEILPYYDPTNISGYQLFSYSGTSAGDITFRDGKVKFIQDPTSQMLKAIEVYNKTNILMQSIEFTYVNKATSRILLKKVEFYDSQHKLINHYLFDYIAEGLGNVPLASNANIDYWGYFSGYLSAGQNLVPAVTASMQPTSRNAVVISTNTRQAVEQYMSTFVLNKITYPTGGYTLYDYECNKTVANLTNYSGHDIGGLRVKSVAHYKTDGATPEVHTYGYPEGSIDYFPGDINDYIYSMQGVVPDWATASAEPWNFFRRRIYSSEPFYDAMPNGSPIVYPTVIEYVGDATQNIGKIQYNYDYESTTNTLYDIYTSYDYNNNPNYLKRYTKPFKSWKSGALSSKIYFKKDGSSYIPVSGESYDYDDITIETLRGLKRDRYVAWASDGCSNGNNVLAETWDQVLTYHGIDWAYNIGDYYITNGYRHLVSSSNLMYDVNGLNPITTTTTYAYGNSDHDQPTQKTVTSSKGDLQISLLKYPHDFASVSPYNTMVNTSHIWSPVVEQLDYKGVVDNNHFLRASKTDYQVWNSNNAQIYPATVSSKKGPLITAGYDALIKYNAYDVSGNVMNVSKTGGAPIAYQWAYQKAYPVAQAMNTPVSIISASTSTPVNDMFYEGFEEGTGNGFFNDSKTGHRSYNGSSVPYTKTISNIDNGNYILSYWLKSGSSWTLQSNTVTASSNTYTISAISGQIDDLRFYPVGAQMTTYTYDPLIGMTSSMDTKGDVTYYEYDNFNRLRIVKNQEGKIIKAYCYNYAGQVTNCLTPQNDQPQFLYARVEVTNILYNNYGDWTDYTETSYGDVYIKFYADAACTIPFTITSATTVTVADFNEADDDYNGYSSATYNNNYTLQPGINSSYLGNVGLSNYHSYYDSNWNYHHSYYSWSYSAGAGPNGDYIPE